MSHINKNQMRMQNCYFKLNLLYLLLLKYFLLHIFFYDMSQFDHYKSLFLCEWLTFLNSETEARFGLRS